jgi:hypothetical protein
MGTDHPISEETYNTLGRSAGIIATLTEIPNWFKIINHPEWSSNISISQAMKSATSEKATLDAKYISESLKSTLGDGGIKVNLSVNSNSQDGTDRFHIRQFFLDGDQLKIFGYYQENGQIGVFAAPTSGFDMYDTRDITFTDEAGQIIRVTREGGAPWKYQDPTGLSSISEQDIRAWEALLEEKFEIDKDLTVALRSKDVALSSNTNRNPGENLVRISAVVEVNSDRGLELITFNQTTGSFRVFSEGHSIQNPSDGVKEIYFKDGEGATITVKRKESSWEVVNRQ